MQYKTKNFEEISYAKLIGKVSLPNEDPKFFLCKNSGLIGIIHKNGTISMYNCELNKLWNTRVNNYTPVDLIYSPNAGYLGMVLKKNSNNSSPNKPPSMLFRVISIENQQNIIHNIEFEGKYQCGCWIEYKSERHFLPNDLDCRDHKIFDTVSTPLDTIHELQAVFASCHETTMRSFVYSKISPDNPIVALIGGKNSPPTMLVLATNKKLNFYVNAYFHIFSIDLDTFPNYDGNNITSNLLVKSVFINDNFTRVIVYTTKNSKNKNKPTLSVGVLKKLKSCVLTPLPSFIGDIIFNYGQYVCTLKAILVEIDQVNVALNSLLDIEFFDVIKEFKTNFPDGFISDLLETLVYGSVPGSMSVFLARLHNEKVVERLMADIPHIKKYWSRMSRLQQLLEMLIINTDNLSYIVFEVMTKKSLVGDSKSNERILKLFADFKTAASNALQESYELFQLQKNEQFIDGIEEFTIWLTELCDRTAFGYSQNVHYTTFSQKFAYGPIGEFCDRLEYLIYFVGRKLPTIVSYIDSDEEDPLLDAKLNTQWLNTTFSNLANELKEIVVKQLFEFSHETIKPQASHIETYLATDAYMPVVFVDKVTKRLSYKCFNIAGKQGWQRYSHYLDDAYKSKMTNINFEILSSELMFDPTPIERDSPPQKLVALHSIIINRNCIGSLKVVLLDGSPDAFLLTNFNHKYIFKQTISDTEGDSSKFVVHCSFDFIVVYHKLENIVYVYDNSDN